MLHIPAHQWLLNLMRQTLWLLCTEPMWAQFQYSPQMCINAVFGKLGFAWYFNTSTDDLWWASSLVLALLICTSAHWSSWAHMLLRSSAHESHAAGLRSVLHHQLMIFCEQNISVISPESDWVQLSCPEKVAIVLRLWWSSNRST